MKYCFTILLAATLLMPSVARAQETKELTNLVIFLRFADDEEIEHDFAEIDSMFNGRTPHYYSVYNYYDAMTYGRIHYNTVYTNNVENGVIVSYRDTMPRGYFQPYTEANPIGYQPWEQPFMGISMREAQLQARAFHYVDSLGLVDTSVVLDGDGDGYIDNVSFVVKGGVGEWASILWPHMEFFPHDSIDHPVTVNGLRPNTFNFEFEGADHGYFTASVFCHELGHSLHLPDHYHYVNYREVTPSGTWDLMCNNHEGANHTAAIYKSKVLGVCDEPIQITCDGDYTLNSVGSSPHRNCYYIKSATDSTQWFTFEYRRKEDPFEFGIPHTGLIAARWNDTVSLDYNGMFANAFFDGQSRAHQYWVFRPGSASDTEDGNVYAAYFCAQMGRTEFGPTTDPYPYLTDGTPETSFEITNIQENGTELTFHVHFLSGPYVGVTTAEEIENSKLKIEINGRSICVDNRDSEVIGLYDVMGRQLATSRLSNFNFQCSNPGVYIVKVGDRPAKKVVVME